jgi:4-amino-4-deoxy-L-arabinose transferase-like glycosyltransferase
MLYFGGNRLDQPEIAMSKKKGKKAAPRSAVPQPAQISASQPSTSAKSSAPSSAVRAAQTPSASSARPTVTYVGIAILIAVFLITRLINLGSYPLHGDEATYIYWGQIAASGPEQRFISMWGGRQPLHTWLVAMLVPLVNSILVPARLISVVFGAFTAVGVYLLARKLFSGRVAFIATLLYLLVPYTVQFDRQVFQDGMISTLAIWTLCLSVLIFERPGWLKAIGLGLLIAAGLLTKSTSWLYLPLIVFCLLPFPRNEWKSRARQAALPLLIALVIGGALYYGLFGSAPEAQQLGEWAARFTYSISELLGFPITAWGDNFAVITRWLITYLTLPVFLTVAAALVLTIWWLFSRSAVSRSDQIVRRELARKSLLLAIWGLVPILGHVILAKSLYARYIVFAIPPLLILAAVFIDQAGLWLARRPALARFRPAYVIGSTSSILIVF